MDDLKELKLLRKKSGMTQAELAHAAGVSQSLIAKIEAGMIDPAFSKTQKIFSALMQQTKKQKQAKDIMRAMIIDISPESTIQEAITLMKKHNISQIPVLQKNRAVGFVSETIILDALMNGYGKKVKDIMQESPPMVPHTASVDAIISFLQYFPLVLVSENGELTGVITKSDVISKITRF